MNSTYLASWNKVSSDQNGLIVCNIDAILLCCCAIAITIDTLYGLLFAYVSPAWKQEIWNENKNSSDYSLINKIRPLFIVTCDMKMVK